MAVERSQDTQLMLEGGKPTERGKGAYEASS